jgi:hypothetical protein
MNSNWTGGLALIIALIVGVGTFMVYDRMNELKTEIEILKVLPNSKSQNLETVENIPTSTAKEEPAPAPDSSIVKIPTALLMQVPSNPSLKPTTTLSLTIPEIAKNADGDLTLQLKIFTDKASGYSAFNPKDVFSIVNLTGDDIEIYKVTGQFDSMPARGSTSGSVLFKTDPNKSVFILKIKIDEDMKFYELDFKNKTYKETVIG